MSLLQRVERAQQPSNGDDANKPVAPVRPPVPPSAAQLSARSEMLRQLRSRLQDEVMKAFDSLLDQENSEAQLKAKVEGIVDRAFFERGADTHIDDDLFHAGNLVRIRVFALFFERRHDFLNVLIVESGFHSNVSRILP